MSRRDKIFKNSTASSQLLFIGMIWFIVLAFLMCYKADAQSIELVRPADFRYYVVVDGDTVANRSLEYKAIQDGINYKEQFPNALITVEPTGIEIRGQIPTYYDYEIIYETQYDTLYLDRVDTVYADTLNVPVYSTHRGDHNTLFKNVDWHLSRDSLSNYLRFTIDTDSTAVDTLYTEVMCGNEWTETNVFVQPAETLTYGIIWNCSSRLSYNFTATNELGWEETIANSYPLWMTDFGDEPSYTLFWGDMTYQIMNGVLTMELATRNIARIKAETVPLHSDIQVLVTEVVDTSHSTGVHLAMRSSESDMQYSVETYLNNNGMGVSIFSDGSWSNPVNFPVQWEYGVPITYTVTLVGDTITVAVNGETFTYTSEVIGSTPPGYLSIGSTGAGTYIINSIETTILD